MKEDLNQTSYVIVETAMLNQQMMENQMITFKITNPRTQESAYAVEREFTADQGTVIVPYWIMAKIGVDEGDTVQISTVELPAATRTVLQPKTKQFAENIKEPRIVLERELRNYPCLTQGSTIEITFANVVYPLYVLKTEPLPAVRCRDVDMIVDFAPLIEEFQHHWNEPDTDSSEDSVEELYYHTTDRGRQRAYRHSTLASREKDLKEGRKYVGVREFKEGQEILPPVAKEPERKHKIKGKWRNLKNESGEIKQRHYDNGAELLQQKPPSNSPFKGTPHHI
ncbi:ubiquitin fusion degradation protein, putative [Trichomonas vaginalis G3]|uniref:Ubiquitin fusion degradation protein, putative n=1 Tax=Trichomonas vaginalis (strain ATCC PRA-98 / G3) TaxID=412133 RepID=A2ECS3_TRIV3|nr:ER-associated misfolded protein catabolic process [Trichomonas vaginalis G3]EAY09569.1 ubiquitin fusion degradation protein, putative [Trichomonas vaginalis G3]KAI5533198.1 ER-associated misfolded protein catabolic process [Trichomonas vaginalis G3]|eukprot:XP_001321792.1 ubiquitin fusion degradation protein [Trichomonas vaginalis G3]